MTQDEKWMIRYKEVVRFIETNHRNPSKHRVEEHLMLNWVKQQRKLLNAGKLKEDRVGRFNELLEFVGKYKRANQYAELKMEGSDYSQPSSEVTFF